MIDASGAAQASPNLTNVQPASVSSTILGQALQTAVSTRPVATAPAGDPTSAKTQADARLTIEENKDHTGYVYKLVDRFTGKTISELPREQVAALSASEGYAAGSVAQTRA